MPLFRKRDWISLVRVVRGLGGGRSEAYGATPLTLMPRVSS